MNDKKLPLPEETAEEFLRTLVEESRDGILVIDAEGAVRFANPTARTLLGDSIPGLIGNQFDALTLEDLGEMIISHGDQQRTIETYTADITWQARPAQLVMLRDITEQAKVNAELQERERLLRETNRMARVGGWALDFETGKVWWSEVTREIHEAPEDFEPHLDKALDFFPQPGRDELANAIEHTRKTGEPYDLELPFITYQGRHLWTRARGEAEFIGDRVVRLRGTFQDITQRKKAEQELSQSEKKYRTLYETMSMGALYITKDLEIHTINPAAEKILGLPAEEISKRKYTDPVYKPIRPTGEPISDAERPSVKALREGKRVEGYVYGIFNPISQKYVWLDVNVVPQFREGEEDPYQAFSTFLDITEQIEAERALRKNEKKYRTLFEEMAQGVVYQNAKGEIISANPAAEKILGLSHDQLLGKESIDTDWQAIRLNGEPLPGEQHPAMVALRTGERVEDFVFGVSNPKRGETVWINVSATPQFREGEEEPYQVFTTFLDITDRIRVQKVLEERLKELRCISNISAVLQEEPPFSEICQITAEELAQAMQYPEIARAVVELGGHHFEYDGFEDGVENRLETPILLHGEQIGRISVCYVEDEAFLLPEEKNLLENLSQRLSAYYDRLQVQRALKESEKRFRTAIIEAPNPLAIYAEDGEILTLNSAWTESSGYDLEDIPTVSAWLKKAYGDSAAEVEDRVQQLFGAQEPVDEGEQRIRTKDGDERIWHFRSAPLGRLPDGRRTVISMTMDVTERVKLREKLKASEKRFRKAVLAAPVPVMIHAEDGEVIIINATWTEISGYTLAEIPTIFDWTKKAYGERQEETQKTIEKLYQLDERIDQGKFTIRTKGGEEREWLFSSAPLGHTPDGRRTVISIAQDITDREWYLRQLEALHEIDQILNETLDLDEVMHRITTQLQKVIEFDTMSVMAYEEDHLRVIACQGFGTSEGIIGLEFPNEPDYPNYEVIEKRQPIAYENIQEAYPAFTQPGNRESNENIKSWMGVPLIREGEVIGMFTIDRTTIQPFTEEEKDIAFHYASRAAIAIHNAKLYEEAQRRLDQLEILREIDSLITSSLTLEKALPALLDHIQQGLSVDAAAVYLLDEETDSLVYEESLGLETETKLSQRIPVGQGFIGQVAETREPLFIPEVPYTSEGEDYPIVLEKEGIKTYYGLPMVAKDKLAGVLELFHRNKLAPDQDWFNFAESLSRQAAIAVDNINLFNHLETANKELRKAYDKTIEGWAKALELRDKETEGHSERLVDLSLRLAREFGFKEEKLPHLRRGILLHDIGKMGIPDAILRKPGPLTEEEWEIMRQHPMFAYNMLKDIEYLEPALVIPHYHHERWDGSGYPEGLAGEEIPLEARIFMVVDIWDALTSDRPYRDAWSEEKTFAYLKEQAGKQLDPKVVEVFLKILREDEGR